MKFFLAVILVIFGKLKRQLGKEMKEILDLANYDPSAPEIESFKSNVDQYGFLHGYYLKAV